MKHYIFIFFIFICIHQIDAQFKYARYILNADNGLPSNKLYDIYCAKSGLVYIAHDKGLSSYDGNVIYNYYNKSYPYISVSNIMESSDSTIWCRSFNGDLFKLVEDTLYTMLGMKKTNYFTYSKIFNDKIIGRTETEIFVYDIFKDKMITKNFNPTFIGKAVLPFVFTSIHTGFSDESNYKLYVDADLNIFYIQSEVKYRYAFHYPNGFTAESIKNKIVLSMLDNSGFFLSIVNQTSLSNSTINNIVVLKDKIWFCTTKGVYFTHLYNSNDTLEYILRDFNVSFVTTNRDGDHMFTTLDNGLITIPSFDVSRISGINEYVSIVHAVKDILYIGTKEGDIFEYSLITHQKRILYKGKKNKPIEFMQYMRLNNTLYASSDHAILIKDGKLIETNFIIKDLSEAEGNVLIATNSSIYLDRGNNLFNNFVSNQINKSPPFLITTIAEDEKITSITYNAQSKDLFYITKGLLFNYNIQKNTFKQYFTSSSVLTDVKYYNNKVYLATKDKGLFYLQKDKFISIENIHPYLAKVFIQKLYVADGNLFIHTLDEVLKLNGNKLDIYNESNGVPASKVSSLSVNDGMIYALTNSDVISFNENISENKKYDADIIIKYIKVDNQILKQAEKFSLDFSKNQFGIYFNLISYRTGKRSALAYSFDEKNWFYLSNDQRVLDLNNIESGNYRLTMAPYVHGELFLNKKKVINFTINPPIYRTWWFISFFALLLVFITWRIMKSIINNQKREFALKKSKLQLENELDKSILSSIKSQMNPHFLFNALNTIQSYIYMNDKKSASIYISKFSELTRSILDMSNKETVSLDEEISSLRLYLELEKMRFEETFEYYIQIGYNIEAENVRIPSMLIQPYIENAIKHGLLHKKNNRKLWLNFKKIDSKLLIRIEDNGIGRKNSEIINKKKTSHISFAMNANKKRLDILKHTFKDIHYNITDKISEMGEPLGTIVEITLPF